MSNKKRAAPGPQSRKSTGNPRDDKGRFVKGVSGNPGGTKQLSPEMKQFARDRSLKGLQKLDAMLDRETTQDKDVIAVVRLFMEYGYGRPAAELDRERLELDMKRLQIEQQRADVATASGPSIVTIEWNGAEELAK